MYSMIKFLQCSIAVIFLLCSLTSPSRAQPDTVEISWSQINSEPSQGLDWSHDGQYIAVTNSGERELTVLDWQNNQDIWSYTFELPLDTPYVANFPVQWSPDGRYLAAIWEYEVYVFDFENRRLLEYIQPLPTWNREQEDFPPRWLHFEWSSDSGEIAALSSEGYIEVLSVDSGAVLQTIDIAVDPDMRGEGIVYTLFDWSPDSRWFAVPHYIRGIPLTATIGFWDRDGNLAVAYETSNAAPDNPLCPVYADMIYQIRDVEWANDSRTLAVGGSYGYGVCLLTVDGAIEHTRISNSWFSSTLKWSPNQRWLAMNGATCVVFVSENIQDADRYTSFLTNTERCVINSLAWSPDSRYIAAATIDGLLLGKFTE